ncbi:uncharacterized protein MELLADRAFT_69965 [Melampsora larici-populina 98AG31]|uniref:Uncharacterized protein n=1 Tax=Melampsora larici-populina (strain 98AG31 / pathotype 3-4-7) TaxID=747676 RepID=F4SCZ3_MELLP|nr:uncharacterized protein MELLADRAFT_69965 [Melampsora larici-populina 98AG31]EGF97485.1 hypothetical protein MELLADRAFT_69965 [Melampsora larici-populina 98AG31]
MSKNRSEDLFPEEVDDPRKKLRGFSRALYVESSEEEDNWEQIVRIKQEPVEEQEVGKKVLTGLIASPTLEKALDDNDFEKHAELMTAYLLRYNPEKMQVLAIERERQPQAQPRAVNEQPVQTQTNSERPRPTTTTSRMNPEAYVETTTPKTNPETAPNTNPKKSKTTKTAGKNIPKGRPMSDEEEGPVRGGGDFVENGIEFADGKVPSHHMTQLTVFCDNRIRKIKGYVPILMFNKAWLEANRNIEGRKSSKKKNKDDDEDSNDEKYEGLSYPVELRLTYGDWVTCFNLFLDYLKDWFHFEKLVLKFEGHKRNVEKVKAENDDNWMVALRYDIMIRHQFWTTRVEGGKVSDPSVRQLTSNKSNVKDMSKKK